MAQFAFLVRHAEHEAGLVHTAPAPHLAGAPRVAQAEETRIVMLIVLNGFTQHFHIIYRRGVLGADGGMAAQAQTAYHLGGTGRVVRFHHLAPWPLPQEMAALHQGHRMRIDFADILLAVLRQAQQAVLNVLLMLAHHGQV